MPFPRWIQIALTRTRNSHKIEAWDPRLCLLGNFLSVSRFSANSQIKFMEIASCVAGQGTAVTLKSDPCLRVDWWFGEMNSCVASNARNNSWNGTQYFFYENLAASSEPYTETSATPPQGCDHVCSARRTLSKDCHTASLCVSLHSLMCF